MLLMRFHRLVSHVGGLVFNRSKSEKLDQFFDWEKRGFEQPSPPFVKRSVLHRCGIPEATWVETGTFKGDTTEFLRHKAKKVFTIEPDEVLFQHAIRRFKNAPNVNVLNGLSEEILPDLVPRLSGDVCFWLDGHFSEGITHKGPVDTPILRELEVITDNLKHLKDVCVLIDDVRLFTYRRDATYPPLDRIVKWAHHQQMDWFVESDIFVAKTRNR